MDDGVITLSGTELEITSNVTIDGDTNGDDEADITIDADGASRVISVTTLFGTVSLDSLIVTGGNAGSGGGVVIAAPYLDLSLNNTWVTGNTGSVGGGLSISGQGSTLSLNDSVISDNDGTLGGGVAVGAALAALNVTNSAVSGNRSSGDGGGIGSAAGDSVVTIVNSTVSSNSADGDGGGISVQGTNSTVTITNATVHGNTAGVDGGGVAVASSGLLTVTHSTISGNSAAANAGGLVSTADTTIANTIIAGNEGDTSDDVDLSGAASVTYSGGNIIGDELTINGASEDTGITLGEIFGSVITVDAGTSATGIAFDAGELGDNGGPVETVALKADIANPAIDSGDASLLDEATVGDLNGDGDELDLVETDARGFERDVDYDGVGSTPDLGAFEAQAVSALVVTTLMDSGADETVVGDIFTEMNDGDGLSLREAILLANGAGGGSITFEAGLSGTVLLGGEGQLTISSDITIDGDTDGDDVADITIDADGGSRVLEIAGAATEPEGHLVFSRGADPHRRRHHRLRRRHSGRILCRRQSRPLERDRQSGQRRRRH